MAVACVDLFFGVTFTVHWSNRRRIAAYHCLKFHETFNEMKYTVTYYEVSNFI